MQKQKKIKANKMQKGKFYRFKNEIIELSFMKEESEYVIVNPPGECDTQSKFGINKNAEVEEVTKEEADNYCSPYNGGYDD